MSPDCCRASQTHAICSAEKLIWFIDENDDPAAADPDNLPTFMLLRVLLLLFNCD